MEDAVCACVFLWARRDDMRQRRGDCKQAEETERLEDHWWNYKKGSINCEKLRCGGGIGISVLYRLIDARVSERDRDTERVSE